MVKLVPVFNVDVAVQRGLFQNLDGSSSRIVCNMEMLVGHCFVWILVQGIFCLVSKKKTGGTEYDLTVCHFFFFK